MSKKIQAVMNEEAAAGPFLGFGLFLFEKLYTAVVIARNMMYDHGILTVKRLPCRVISVGNLTVGGTGKTPMTIYLAMLLKALGYNVAVISRGYKGAAEHNSAVVSDGETIGSGPEIAGDEPYMMAQKLKGIPVLVGADRFRVGLQAMQQFSPDIIVLDDGFQHRRLKRDIDIVLVDDKSFLGNRHLLPRGLLREPMSGVARADLLVLTRCRDDGTSQSLETLTEMVPAKPVFTSFHEPYLCGIYHGNDNTAEDLRLGGESRDFTFLKKARVFVFSGIAKNNEFLSTVTQFCSEVAGVLVFDDHHQYTASDFQNICQHAKNCAADLIVTTEKDHVKIAGKMSGPLDIVVIGVRMSLGAGADRFKQNIREKVEEIRL